MVVVVVVAAHYACHYAVSGATVTRGVFARQSVRPTAAESFTTDYRSKRPPKTQSSDLVAWPHARAPRRRDAHEEELSDVTAFSDSERASHRSRAKQR